MIGSFVALDVETANADLASICQVGVVRFTDGVVTDTWETRVNPEAEFDERNIAVHGIDSAAIATSPTFREIATDLFRQLDGNIVASHMPFDRVSLQRSSSRYGLSMPDVSWLDTARIARRTWPEFSQRGYGLFNVAGTLGITFTHHDAAEDARAAGEVLVQACRVATCSVADWKHRCESPITQKGTIARDGNPDGPLFGHVIVFTGEMDMPRKAAATLAADAGCKVANNVTRQTTLLVVGDQDLRQTKGNAKSSKHREAEKLIAQGQPIRIMQESDFVAMMSLR